ncbi:MAG: 1-acyl-sn-glycerol-3-phosphate acyltransferase [Acidobacteriia bacterium]|nr:1-acyl-sn-glycerol-3-phosphate acyltransferase [Terriglobia bacterium]
MLRATLIYIFVGLYVAMAAPIGLAWSFLSGSTDLLFTLAHFCIRVAGWLCNVRVVVRGRDLVRPRQAYLFLSNHQGNFDGPLLYYATGRNLRAVIKKEIMRIPVLSQVLRKVSFVPIDRTDPLNAHAGIDRAAQLLKGGHSFFAFPEGTRSRDGRLGVFKKGVFVMAIKAGVPVMPVSICNSRAIQPPGHYAIKPGTVELVFHPPIATEHMRLQDRDHLLQLTQAAIAQGLPNAVERE